MTDKAHKVWKAFCEELIHNGLKDSEDVRQALATSLREVIHQLGYFKYDDDGIHGNTIVNVRDIIVLSDELEVL